MPSNARSNSNISLLAALVATIGPGCILLEGSTTETERGGSAAGGSTSIGPSAAAAASSSGGAAGRASSAGDRDTDLDGANTDRQRVEIKVYDPSANHLKGYRDQTMTYGWRFQVNAEMAFSDSFTHLFQLKAVDGDDDTPVITLSGATRDGSDRIEIRHSASSGQEVIADASWDGLRGQWLEVRVKATFAESGVLEMSVTDSAGGQVLGVSQNLDLWRDGASYVRPKWGIYRSLLDQGQLRAEEESVRFANIAITNGPSPESDCR